MAHSFVWLCMTVGYGCVAIIICGNCFSWNELVCELLSLYAFSSRFCSRCYQWRLTANALADCVTRVAIVCFLCAFFSRFRFVFLGCEEYAFDVQWSLRLNAVEVTSSAVGVTSSVFWSEVVSICSEVNWTVELSTVLQLHWFIITASAHWFSTG